jgi:hypothetical protein
MQHRQANAEYLAYTGALFPLLAFDNSGIYGHLVGLNKSAFHLCRTIKAEIAYYCGLEEQSTKYVWQTESIYSPVC